MQTEGREEELLGIVLENCRRMTGLSWEQDPNWADRKLRHLGMDSVGLFELLNCIESRAGLVLPDTVQLEDPTPRQLVRILMSANGAGGGTAAGLGGMGT